MIKDIITCLKAKLFATGIIHISEFYRCVYFGDAIRKASEQREHSLGSAQQCQLDQTVVVPMTTDRFNTYTDIERIHMNTTADIYNTYLRVSARPKLEKAQMRPFSI